MSDDDEWMTPAEVTALIGVTSGTLRQWRFRLDAPVRVCTSSAPARYYLPVRFGTALAIDSSELLIDARRPLKEEDDVVLVANVIALSSIG
ncbi:hypothetical protein FB462_2064 [Curtobacterium citreum]|nr:hypothetical protein FB462_2064 [Curtobacterium citreum]